MFGFSKRAPTCPECGSKLFTNPGSESLRCPNLDCPAQVRARIEHWCSASAMDIPGADASMIAKLVAKGLVRDVAELYRLKLAEIASIEGVNLDSARQLFDAIAVSRSREPWRLLFGLSIPWVASTDAQKLCEHFKAVDNVFAASVERLTRAGVSEETARSIVHWHSDSVNRKLVKRLIQAGLHSKA
jgi:DNA ligase (NAD+)